MNKKLFEEKMVSKQGWTGNLCFDPDSSPKAWEHYKKYYSNDFWTTKYDFEKIHFFELAKDGGGMYADCPIEKHNRLVAIEIGSKTVKNGKGFEGIDYYNAVLRLGGETDFNFKEESKYIVFLNKLKNSYKDDELAKYKKTLETCKAKHHTLVNFSLMQVVGNIQNFKSKGLCLKNGKNEWLDRLDTFVYKLDEYYKCKEDDRKNTEIIMFANEPNRDSLREYLNTFAEIYDYCKKVYFIEDRNLVNKIINEGKKEIKSGEDLVRYMTLALDFWNEKQKCFNDTCK